MFNDKIKKESFWFKLHKSWPTDQYYRLLRGHQVSLCSWFWKGCSILAIYVLFAVIGLIITTFIASMLFTLMVSPYLGFWLNEGIVSFNIIAWFVIFMALCLFAVFDRLPQSIRGNIPWIPTYISKYLPERKQPEKRSKSKVERQPNILVQYIKAKKAKWCPLLELEDEDNK